MPSMQALLIPESPSFSYGEYVKVSPLFLVKRAYSKVLSVTIMSIVLLTFNALFFKRKIFKTFYFCIKEFL